MHTTRIAPTRAEIFARVDPERKQELSGLQKRFGSTKTKAVVEDKPTTLIFSGSPDFIFTRNEDETLRPRRVLLPMRHLLIDEPVTPVERHGLTYGNDSESTDLSLYKSTDPEKDLIIGIFTSRVMDSIREQA